MIELAVVGIKDSGKTTLIEELLPLLKTTGLRVATVKHTSHDHSFDTQGKDSHRHRQAGSKLAMAISCTEIALFAGNDSQVEEELRRLISRHADLCLIEGDKMSDRAKLLVTANKSDMPDPLPNNIIATYGYSSLGQTVQHFKSDESAKLSEFILERLSSAKERVRVSD